MEAVRATTFQGPIPPPEILQKYGDVRADLVDRIVRMAEAQGSHRRDMERTIVEGGVRGAVRGQIFGLVIGLFGLAAATVCVVSGHGTAGTIIGTVDLVALVSVFVIGKRRAPKRPIDRATIPAERTLSAAVGAPAAEKQG
jgi:uncharacterized membrane protein